MAARYRDQAKAEQLRTNGRSRLPFPPSRHFVPRPTAHSRATTLRIRVPGGVHFAGGGVAIGVVLCTLPARRACGGEIVVCVAHACRRVADVHDADGGAAGSSAAGTAGAPGPTIPTVTATGPAGRRPGAATLSPLCAEPSQLAIATCTAVTTESRSDSDLGKIDLRAHAQESETPTATLAASGSRTRATTAAPRAAARSRHAGAVDRCSAATATAFTDCAHRARGAQRGFVATCADWTHARGRHSMVAWAAVAALAAVRALACSFGLPWGAAARGACGAVLSIATGLPAVAAFRSNARRRNSFAQGRHRWAAGAHRIGGIACRLARAPFRSRLCPVVRLIPRPRVTSPTLTRDDLT